MIGRWR